MNIECDLTSIWGLFCTSNHWNKRLNLFWWIELDCTALAVRMPGKYWNKNLIHRLVVIYATVNDLFCLGKVEWSHNPSSIDPYNCRKCCPSRSKNVTARFTTLNLQELVEFQDTAFATEVPLEEVQMSWFKTTRIVFTIVTLLPSLKIGCANRFSF